MSDSLIQIGLYVFAGALAGGAIGWFLRAASSRRAIEEVSDRLQLKFDEAAKQRDRFNSENMKLRSNMESMQAVVNKHQVAATRSKTELESAREKLTMLSKDLVGLGARRDQLESELNESRSAVATARYQIGELENEFEKAGEFYKGELVKALEKRKSVEVKLDDAKAEQASLANLLDASQSEKESVNKMLSSAQSRLDNLDAVEARAIELEAENAELRHAETKTKQEIEALRRDVEEMEALKIQNQELSHCLQSMENSRQQYEKDAKRYRDQAEHSEQLSDTLRIKLDDVEKSLSAMAKHHEKEERRAREEQHELENALPQPEREIDDLTKIVGIGKVFQRALHDLGIYSFKQIANFGPADIARVNMALKENRGRMEQDDWIGQAKELYFKKHSEMVEH